MELMKFSGNSEETNLSNETLKFRLSIKGKVKLITKGKVKLMLLGEKLGITDEIQVNKINTPPK